MCNLVLRRGPDFRTATLSGRRQILEPPSDDCIDGSARQGRPYQIPGSLQPRGSCKAAGPYEANLLRPSREESHTALARLPAAHWKASESGRTVAAGRQSGRESRASTGPLGRRPPQMGSIAAGSESGWRPPTSAPGWPRCGPKRGRPSCSLPPDGMPVRAAGWRDRWTAPTDWSAASSRRAFQL